MKSSRPAYFTAGLGWVCLSLAWGSLAPRPHAQDSQGPGPWDHDVEVWRIAGDGRNSKLATFPRAGVPTLARLRDGKLMAAHQHFHSDNPTDFDKVAVRFSTDEGASWTGPQVIRLTGLPRGMRFPFDPTLVAMPEGPIRMYFTSRYQDRADLPAIYSAISSNGIDFTVEPGKRFGIDGRPVIDCAAVLHRGRFHLYAPDNGAAPGSGQPAFPGPEAPPGTAYHAVSDDGLRFTRADDVRIEGRRRWLGNVLLDGSALRFFGTGDAEGGLWMAASADGQSWTSCEPIRIPGADPGAVAARDGGWIIAATGAPRAGTPSASRRQSPAEVDRAFPGSAPNPRRFTFVPSTAAGDRGVAVGILLPPRPRYTNGAPVVILVPGGVDTGGTEGRPEYAGLGFIQVHFAFPGGTGSQGASGGTYDYRGSNCVRALADVIRFACGRIPDTRGKSIQDLASGVCVLTNNVGLAGSSHGGNACGRTMAVHGKEFPDLAFYASMESPYGEGNVNIELGNHEQGVNPAYDPARGRLDLSRLSWAPALQPGPPRRWQSSGRPLRGALFFDMDGDGLFSESRDFPANAFVQDLGAGPKVWYTPRLLREAAARKLLGAQPPAHVPLLAAAEEYWRWRDAEPSLPAAVENCTRVAVIVYANQRDHIQAAPDHPHILAQVEGFRKAGARFIRLNPDRAYVEQVLPRARLRTDQLPVFSDNDAGREWTRGNIAQGLEPDAFPPMPYMQAAVAELADRVQARVWLPNLSSVLFPDAPADPRNVGPGIQPRPSPKQRRGG